MRYLLTNCVILASLLFFAPYNSSAQWTKGVKLAQLGTYSSYGYPNLMGDLPNSPLPVISISGDYFLHPMVSIGAYAAYTYSYFKFDNPSVGYTNKWTGWDLGIRSSLHMAKLFKAGQHSDPYVSVFGGYSSKYMNYDKSNVYRSQLNFRKRELIAGALAGYRYFITDHVGIYAEAGIAKIFFIGGGISFKW